MIIKIGDKLKENEKAKKICKWYEEFCFKYNLDPLKFDILSEMDLSISVNENKTIILDKIKPFIKPELMLSRNERKQIQKEEDKEKQGETDKIINEWKKIPAEEIIKTEKTEILKHYLNMINKNHIKSLFVFGRTGIGKTYITINTLKGLDVDFSYKSGYTTPLELYKTLFHNKNKILILDDLEGLFKNKISVSLLKSATWENNGKRIISYDTTSKLMGDIPNTFKFEGRLIILTNELNGDKDENFRALVSRSLTYELSFTHNEIIEISNKILLNMDLKPEQLEKIKDIINNVLLPISNFNLRILNRLVEMIKYDLDKAKELFFASLNIDDDEKLVYELINSNLDISEQNSIFIRETGKSVRTFRRIKKRVMCLADKRT